MILITKDNLSEWILPDEPLHSAYQYLSFTHRADYLRTYFMHFYGGGYADIKKPSGSWTQAFDEMKKNKSILVSGYHETGPEDVAYRAHQGYWKVLVGNGAYILRPQTSFTAAWYNEMIDLLDKKLPLLKKHPASFPQDCKERNTGYPIEWNELNGRIFHKHLIKYIKNTAYSVPRPVCKNYR